MIKKILILLTLIQINFADGACKKMQKRPTREPYPVMPEFNLNYNSSSYDYNSSSSSSYVQRPKSFYEDDNKTFLNYWDMRLYVSEVRKERSKQYYTLELRKQSEYHYSLHWLKKKN